MLIEFTVAHSNGWTASSRAGMIADELEKWSEQYQIPIRYKLHKSILTLCFDNDEIYTFFGLTFDPKPTYQSGQLIEDFECPWRLLSDHEVQHRQTQ